MRAWHLIAPLCVLPLLAHAVGQSATDAEPTVREVRDLLGRGLYDAAERQATKLATRLTAAGGEATFEFTLAQDLLVDALTRGGKGGEASTLDLAERVVSLKEALFGRSHLETAQSLQNLGNLLLERGEFRQALAAYERGLGIREAQLAREGPELADSLDCVSLALIRLGRFDDARKALKRSQTIRESMSDDSGLLARARTLELVGWLNRYSGDYPAARPAVVQALDLRRRIAPQHPDFVYTLELFGDLQFLDGDIGGAARTWADALALGERTLGPEHPILAALLRRRALTARAFGNQREVREWLDRGLSIAAHRMPACNPEHAWLINDTASSALDNGEYVEALALYQRARVTFEKCQGPRDSNVATALHNQAEVAADMGDLAEAERLDEEAIRLWSANLGPNHPYVARGVDALAAVAAARGQSERARSLYRRALGIRRKAVGPEHPDVAWTLTNLARLDADSGRLTAALIGAKSAIDIYQRTGAQDDPDHFARVLALRGEIEMRRADYASARASFEEAMSTRERVFGTEHPLAAESRAQLAVADFGLNSTDASLAGALAAERIGREHLRFTVRYLPERQAMAYAANRPRGLDLALSIAAARPSVDTLAVFDALIRSRGVILDELAERAGAAASASSDLSPFNAVLVAARQRFATLILRSWQGEESVSRTLLDEARRQKEDAERALVERSGAARAELAHSNLGLTDIRAALPPDSALISFVRYNRTTFSNPTNAASLPRNTASYLALITRTNSATVDVVPLGPASSIDDLVSAWHDQAGGRSLALSSAAASLSAFRTVGTRLRRRIWDPVAEHVRDVRRVFVVPDGALNLVSFAALPTGTRGFLLESGPVIHYAATERDLIHRDEPLMTGGLLAIGGPAFGSDPHRLSTAAPDANRGEPRTRGEQYGCSTVATLQFQALPETAREAAEIAKLWPSQASGEVTLLTGSRASETAVKAAAAGRRVVHLATHGFFLTSRCALGIENTRSVGGLTSRTRAIPTGLLESPLALAGLALSGANRHGSGSKTVQDDGILTGEEVAGLNLHGTEWAVLSACDTGLGEIKAGEGVFGLRRAFQIAGARTVIMSLWSVDDAAARLWMRALYEGRLQKHLSTADAMHQASLRVLRARRASGQSTHPFYWAGFVAAGDWR